MKKTASAAIRPQIVRLHRKGLCQRAIAKRLQVSLDDRSRAPRRQAPDAFDVIEDLPIEGAGLCHSLTSNWIIRWMLRTVTHDQAPERNPLKAPWRGIGGKCTQDSATRTGIRWRTRLGRFTDVVRCSFSISWNTSPHHVRGA
jgi:hypothetical protein